MAGEIQPRRPSQMDRAGLWNPVCPVARRPHLSWHLGTGALPVALRTRSRFDRCAADDARMVSAHRRAGSFVWAKPLLALAAVKVGVAIVRFCRWRAARSRRALRRPCLFHPFTSVPRGPHEAASGDGLPVSAPAAGASQWAPAPWAHSLPQARDWRGLVLAALARPQLGPAFSRGGRKASIH